MDGGTTILVHLADQRRSRTDSHGIIGFSLGLVRALPSALGDRGRLVVLVNDELAAELGESWGRPVDELRVVPAPRSTLDRLRVDHLLVDRVAAEIGADVVLLPKGFLPVGRRRSGARRAVCLHDDIPLRMVRERRLPLRRRARAAYFSGLLHRSVRRADVRLFVSAFTESRLTARTGPRPSDVVTGEGLTVPQRPLVPLGDRDRRALVLGSTHPHKRVLPGLDLLAGSPPLVAAIDRVTVLGALPGGADRAGSLPIEHLPGPLASGDLAALIATSRVLVHPSEYEGFGLPPLEAAALGTPVVHRRTEAAIEVAPDLPGGYDVEDSVAFDAAVAEALALDDARLAELSAVMWARLDWAAVAARVAAALTAA